MTDEQIKVLKAMRDEIGLLAASLRAARLGSEVPDVKVDALTAALDFIRDMREIEAAAEEVIFDEKINCRVYRLRKWHIWGLDRATHCYDSLHEAFKSAVKGGKE